MRFGHDQHTEMAKRLYERSKTERNPEAAKKQAAMAKVFRQLAERAAKQAAELGRADPTDKATGQPRKNPAGNPLRFTPISTWKCRSACTSGRIQQRSPEDQGSDGEIDHQTSDVDQGRDERCRSACRIEAGPLQDEWEHGSGQRAKHDDADQGGADSQRDQHPVLAVVIEAQILPQRNADDADKAQHRPESQSIRDFPQRCVWQGMRERMIIEESERLMDNTILGE
jgi:hypothetical protein